MLNYRPSFECWSDLPSLMQAWIRTIIPSLFACYAANRHQRLIMFFELFIVLRSLSVLWTLGFASLCQHNSPIRYASWAKHSHEAEVMGYWLWAIGYRMGYAACRYPCLSPLTFRLIAHSLPKAVFWRGCQRQMHERYEVTRVKTDSPFGRTSYVRPKGEKFDERFEEHWNLFGATDCQSRT